MPLRKSILTGVSAIALSVGLACSAQADTMLPVTNLEFNMFNAGSSFPAFEPKDLFTEVMPANWGVGTAGAMGTLTFVGQQGSEGMFNPPTSGPRPAANVYGVYGTFSNTVPAGTNFYQADGNPQFESTILQTIPGLTPGVYTIQFQQAAGQQIGFSMATTEQWKVFLGVGGIGVSCPASPLTMCMVTGTAGNVEVDSPLMNAGAQMNVDWQTTGILSFPTLPAGDIPAGGTVLTFLAWGDGGSDVNEPPTVFLEGVNTRVVPEPTTLSLLGVGLLGLGGIAWRRRNKRSAPA